MSKVVIIWKNADILFCLKKADKKLEKELSYVSKTMVMDGWKMKVKRSTEKTYNILSNTPSGVVYQVPHGLIERVKEYFTKNKIDFMVSDQRVNMEEPKLELMEGFRFDQKNLITSALTQNRSGIVDAVTRYGKSYLILNALRAFPNTKTVVLAPGIDLLEQTLEFLKENLPGRDVVGIFTGSRNRTQSDDITVCSMDSMTHLDKQGTKLLLIDEPHSIVTDSRLPELVKFENAKILGFGATVEGRWSGNDIMIEGCIGPVLSKKTYLEGVKEGAICPIEIKFVKLPFTHFDVSTHRTAYKRLVYDSDAFVAFVKEVLEQIPKDWQTLLFINNEKQAKKLLEAIPEATLCMDKLMKNKKERKELFKKLKTGEISRCICSNIYSTGVTIDGIRVIINCDGGGAGILSVQKPGRLAEIKEGKEVGYVVDFIHECTSDKDRIDSLPFHKKMWNNVVRDSWNRFNSYAKKGYRVKFYKKGEKLQFK